MSRKPSNTTSIIDARFFLPFASGNKKEIIEAMHKYNTDLSVVNDANESVLHLIIGNSNLLKMI
jgi:hypothetical protein